MTERVYRRRTIPAVLVPTYVGIAGGLAALAYFVQPAIAVASIPFVALAWRTWRLGVAVDSARVTVRNTLRDRRVDWADVDRFDWGTWWGFPIGGVHLRDGRFVRAFALNPPWELQRGVDKAVPRALDGLNAELARVRSGSGGQPPADVPAPSPIA